MSAPPPPAPHGSPSAAPPSPGAPALRGGPLWLGAGAAVFAAAMALLALTGTEIQRSADDYGTQPLWQALLPVAAGLLLLRLLPASPPPAAGDPASAVLGGRRLGTETLLLLACLAGFIGAASLSHLGFPGADLVYPVAKVVLLLAVPAVLMRSAAPAGLRGGPGPVAVGLRPGPSSWTGLLVVAGYLWATVFSPIAAPLPDRSDLPPLAVTLVVATITFLTASVLEEVFFRAWLQTRLEALFGAWPGIVLTALAFAAMHVVSHRATGEAGIDLAVIIAVQGTMGLLFGYLWARHRNMWTIVLLHTGVNSLALIPAFVVG